MCIVLSGRSRDRERSSPSTSPPPTSTQGGEWEETSLLWGEGGSLGSPRGLLWHLGVETCERPVRMIVLLPTQSSMTPSQWQRECGSESLFTAWWVWKPTWPLLIDPSPSFHTGPFPWPNDKKVNSLQSRRPWHPESCPSTRGFIQHLFWLVHTTAGQTVKYFGSYPCFGASDYFSLYFL